METTPETVGPVAKVSLLVRAKAHGRKLEEDGPASVSFIYGIGSQGITPFEKQLSGKTVGGSVCIRIEPGEQQSFFGHLTCTVMEAVEAPPPVDLEITVSKLEQADDRELVKAMAELSSCGSGCDCGCGC